MSLRSISTKLLLVLFCAAGYSSLICLHEFSHCVAARLVGLHPTAFRIGQGEPSLVLTNWGGTEIRLSPFLLGGSVRVEEFQLNPGTPSISVSTTDCLKSFIVRIVGPLGSSLLAVAYLMPAMRRKSRLNGLRQLVCQIFPSYCADLFKTIATMLLFLPQRKVEREEFYYWRLQDIPFRATDNLRLALIALGGTAFTEAVFNVLPFPVLDGGKAAIDVYELFAGRSLDGDTEIIVTVVSALVLALAVMVSVYRGYYWPFPRLDEA